MPPYRLQEFSKQATAFSPHTYGRIFREVFVDERQAVEAARALLAQHSHLCLRVLDGEGRAVWSSESG